MPRQNFQDAAKFNWQLISIGERYRRRKLRLYDRKSRLNAALCANPLLPRSSRNKAAELRVILIS